MVCFTRSLYLKCNLKESNNLKQAPPSLCLSVESWPPLLFDPAGCWTVSTTWTKWFARDTRELTVCLESCCWRLYTWSSRTLWVKAGIIHTHTPQSLHSHPADVSQCSASCQKTLKSQYTHFLSRGFSTHEISCKGISTKHFQCCWIKFVDAASTSCTRKCSCCWTDGLENCSFSQMKWRRYM